MNESSIEIFRTNCAPLKPIATGQPARLTRLDGIEAILFDIYGTLFISGSGDVGHAAANPTTQSLDQAAGACDLELNQPAEQILERFYESIRESHRRSKALGNEFPEVDVLQIWCNTLPDVFRDTQSAARFAIEFESRSNPVWPMPNAKEVLLQLGTAFPMGIISNAQFFTLDLFEALLGLSKADLGFDQELEVYSFAEETAKPGRRIFEIAVERLKNKGIRPENVLYVGNDMLNDIRGAQLVGFKTALFAGDQRSLRLRKEDQRVDGVEPDIIVNGLSQIPECLYLPK